MGQKNSSSKKGAKRAMTGAAEKAKGETNARTAAASSTFASLNESSKNPSMSPSQDDEGIGVHDEEFLSGIKFSTAEVQQLHAHFRLLAVASPDSNRIDFDQFKDALNVKCLANDGENRGGLATPGALERLYAAFDLDKTGKLDFREFILGISKLSRGSMREKLQLSFDVYDVDRSGAITKKEMIGVLSNTVTAESGFGLGFSTVVSVEEFVGKLYAACDVEENGKLTYVEYLRAALKYPQLLRILGETSDAGPSSASQPSATSAQPPQPPLNEDAEASSQEVHFSTAEVSTIYDHFARLAAASPDPNLIYKDQFKVALEESSVQWPGARADALFDAFDADNSGAVDFKQFILGLSKLSRGTPREKLALSFDVYDNNNEGVISSEEMRSALLDYSKDDGESSGKIDAFVASVFEKFDKDGRGLSYREYLSAVMKQPNLLNFSTK